MAMTTIRELRRAAEARLRAAGVDSPDLDARLLVERALGLSREALLVRGDAAVEGDGAARVAALVERRAAREPVSRILGSRGFWTLELGLNAATLDPRPDTETLVEAALAAVGDRAAPLRILDLGTGTGCILLALLAELPNACGLGVDLSPEAVAAARANAAANGLAPRATFAAGSWGDGLAGGFDLVVSNPPYIPTADIAGLEPEVRVHDPWAALDGGADGLDAYRAIVPQLGGLLKATGAVAFEVGQGQSSAVARLLSAAGFLDVRTFCDLGGVERVVRGGKTA